MAPEKPLAGRFRRLQNVDYTAIDKKCPGYRYPGYVKDGDITQLEFADNSFDIVNSDMQPCAGTTSILPGEEVVVAVKA